MADLVCDTTALQYLHQLGLLEILRLLADRVVIPSAVVDELLEGRMRGYDVPDVSRIEWMEVRRPGGKTAPPTPNLGAGERDVISLALEYPGLVSVLDDGAARDAAKSLRLPLTGTLGLLVDAKRSGLITAVSSQIERLEELGFRVSARARQSALRLARELSYGP